MGRVLKTSNQSFSEVPTRTRDQDFQICIPLAYLARLGRIVLHSRTLGACNGSSYPILAVKFTGKQARPPRTAHHCEARGCPLSSD